MTLPLWLELDGLRVIHAYWSDPDIASSASVSASNTLTDHLVVDASTDGHQAYDSIERLIKGPEVRLPNGMTFHDKGRHTSTCG